MKRVVVVLVMASLGALAFAEPADAHGRRGSVRLGVVIGAPLGWYGYGWPHHYPYYERVIVERPGPTVYVEKDADGVERDADQYWYWCPDSETYYPYVKTCASSWHRVVPQSPPPR